VQPSTSQMVMPRSHLSEKRRIPLGPPA
jgi:hypothetical protein